MDFEHLFFVMILFLRFRSGGFIVNRCHALIYFSCYQFWKWLLGCRGVLSNQSNICDGAFTKIFKTLQLLSIFAKSTILDVRLGSGYASGVKINKITKGFHGSNIALAIRYLKQMGLFPLLSFSWFFIRVLLLDDRFFY